jgi:hypothetical protein
MPKGTELTNAEQTLISDLSNFICVSLRRRSNDNTLIRKRKAAKISPRSKRQLFLLVSHDNLSASQLRETLELPITTRRVQQLLKSNPNFIYRKTTSSPTLSEVYINARLLFAQCNINKNEL